MTSTDIVRSFWEAMRSNDFAKAAHDWLTPDFVGLWPQTGEVIQGPAQYGAVNHAFPGGGDWKYEEISLLADGIRVVTDMRITNDPLEVTIHAITFHEVSGNLIRRQTEYWPDTYPVPAWRSGILRIDRSLAR